jgi:Transglycosylase SLT domain
VAVPPQPRALLLASATARGKRQRPGRWSPASGVMALAVGVMALATDGRPAQAASLVAGAVALDHIAFAVDGAELSHGTDSGMWRSDLDGPQGPMQVSAAAAADVGGGDRFDVAENRLLGRAYLAHLYRRYANWPDAVAAYNWGPGRMDAWIGAGRPIDKFPIGVSLYRFRVLFGGSAPAADGSGRAVFACVHLQARRSLADRRHPSRDSIAVERLFGPIIAESALALR